MNLKKPEEEGKAMAVKAGIQFVKMDAAGLKKYSDTLDAENMKEAAALDAKGLSRHKDLPGSTPSRKTV